MRNLRFNLSVKLSPLQLALLVAPTMILCSCFTGIESTKRIQPSKQDLKVMAVTPEELLMDSIEPQPLALWPTGKRFVVADPRLALITIPLSGATPSLAQGERISFVGTQNITLPDGSESCALVFEDDNADRFLINTSQPAAKAPQTLLSDRLPMLRDLDMITAADSMLRGRTLWSLSDLVYDRLSARQHTLRFLPLQVDSVTPGDAMFPMRVWSTDSLSQPIFYFMGFNDNSSQSRPISRIFSLSDPRLKYPRIPENHWQAIRRRAVLPGMTKEECRLSLGSPSDATGGRDYSSTIDLWQYPDGTYLRFVDGLLVDFRR